LPESVLLQREWKVWLAHHDGVPAAAGYTYGDGHSAGGYLLATLPEHRSAGLGRAIMTAAIAAHPKQHIALEATDAGAPLYRSFNFVEVATATWYIRAIVD
jgi:GNAT superfamily N-acetyltransferase